MHQHRTPSRTRFALFAASALALALSLATTTPTAGAPVAEQADNDSLSLNGTGRYADQLAQIVLEYGVDIAHNPYALLVEFEPDADPADVDALLESAHAALVERFGESDVYLLETRADLDKTQETLEAHPAVRHVAFDTTVHVSTSNDPEAGSLWGLFGTQGINATAAWDLTDTLAPVVVAVIDSGVDTNHPDLAANIWTNPDEIAGNGIDDDGNGLVDDIHGWDFVEDDATPNDPNGHGTHVAGTIAAVRDNGIGVAGVADNAQIMALRFLNAEGSGYTSDALAALEYAIDKGAPISNNSWGGGSFNTALSSLIASNADTHLFVAAAGNSGQNIDSSPQYPAAYTNEHPERCRPQFIRLTRQFQQLRHDRRRHFCSRRLDSFDRAWHRVQESQRHLNGCTPRRRCCRLAPGNRHAADAIGNDRHPAPVGSTRRRVRHGSLRISTRRRKSGSTRW